jgi:hypothetical protein
MADVDNVRLDWHLVLCRILTLSPLLIRSNAVVQHTFEVRTPIQSPVLRFRHEFRSFWLRTAHIPQSTLVLVGSLTPFVLDETYVIFRPTHRRLVVLLVLLCCKLGHPIVGATLAFSLRSVRWSSHLMRVVDDGFWRAWCEARIGFGVGRSKKEVRSASKQAMSAARWTRRMCVVSEAYCRVGFRNSSAQTNRCRMPPMLCGTSVRACVRVCVHGWVFAAGALLLEKVDHELLVSPRLPVIARRHRRSRVGGCRTPSVPSFFTMDLFGQRN